MTLFSRMLTYYHARFSSLSLKPLAPCPCISGFGLQVNPNLDLNFTSILRSSNILKHLILRPYVAASSTANAIQQLSLVIDIPYLGE